MIFFFTKLFLNTVELNIWSYYFKFAIIRNDTIFDPNTQIAT